MTENKRFTVDYQNGEIVSVHDKGKLINIEQMVECLNNLHEEVLYWKQVASQRANEIEVMTHKLQMK